MRFSLINKFKKLAENKSKELIELISNMNDSEILHTVYFLYFDCLYKELSFFINDYKIVTLEKIDILNEFMQQIIKISRAYRGDTNSSFINYIKGALKNFTYSLWKYWNCKKRAFHFIADNTVYQSIVPDEDMNKIHSENIDKLDYEKFISSLNKKERKILNIISYSENPINKLITTNKINNLKIVLERKIQAFYGNHYH